MSQYTLLKRKLQTLKQKKVMCDVYTDENQKQ